MSDINECPICIKQSVESNSSNSIQWVRCDICQQWFHAPCLKLSMAEVDDLHSYHCESCSKQHGPSVPRRKLKRSKVQIDYVALNDGDVFAVDKSEHPHINKFVDFQESTDVQIRAPEIKDTIDKDYALRTRLSRPVLVLHANYESVGMKIPKPSNEITIDFIADVVGDDTPLDVMDVLTQQGVSSRWDLGKWRDYFHTDELSRDRIRNVISLEISDVDEFGGSFTRPTMVRDLDLVDMVWKEDIERPKVTKYCLMSVKRSFTDFHIDFSGTAVYYTVCSGVKEFLMYPPTEENLDLYTAWCLEPNQNYLWFGDYNKPYKGKTCQPSQGLKVKVNEGNLFIIPSGWIHAVYTPQDSIVIGGNFLTLMDIQMHLKISQIEKSTNVPAKYRFPKFNKVLWLTSWYYLNHKGQYLLDLLPTDVGVKNEDSEDARIKNEKTYKEDATLKNHKVASKDKEANLKYEDATKLDQEQFDGRYIKTPYNILKCLIQHLRTHNELSKTNKIARASIPTNLIGKDITAYLTQLENWLAKLSV